MTRDLIKATLIASVPLVLCACSEGAGTAASATSASLGVPEGECQAMMEVECEMFHAINEVRVQNGVPAMAAHSKCVDASGVHAEDMAARGYFSHNSPEETWSARMSRFGLSGSAVAENIAWGNGVEGTVDQWMNSTGHRNNILNPAYKSTGLGTAVSSTGRRYWVQCFSGMMGD